MSYEISAHTNYSGVINRTEATARGALVWAKEYRERGYQDVIVRKAGAVIADSELTRFQGTAH